MKELLEISKYAGMREDLAQAGGGNSSLKLDEKRMAIKASGIQLADLTSNSGYSIVDYPIIVKYMKDLAAGNTTEPDKQVLERALLEGKRASIETFLHAITDRVTLHTHSVAVNVLTSRKNGMETIKNLFPDALVVDYGTPGLRLAELYYRAYLKACGGAEEKYSAIFLKNHGVVVSGNSAEDVIRTTESISQKIETEIGMDNRAYRQAYNIYKTFLEWEPGENKIVVKVENAAALQTYAQYEYKIWDFQMFPDCIVFCGKSAFVYTDECGQKEYLKYAMRFGSPTIVCSGNNLYIRAESVRKAREVESILAFSARIALANIKQSMSLLDEDEQNFLVNWDAEKYRQVINE